MKNDPVEPLLQFPPEWRVGPSLTVTKASEPLGVPKLLSVKCRESLFLGIINFYQTVKTRSLKNIPY
jgi:hypothetical protein